VIQPTSTSARTVEGAKVSEIILSTFRFYGLLYAAGDVLTASEGLSSARWQVLGAIFHAERPLTVPQIARRMGLTRQTVHVTVRRLVDDGLLELAPNEDHSRSHLVRFTELGAEKILAMDVRQAAFANKLGEGIDDESLDAALRVIEELSARLEIEGPEE
jgi:DNA-binding MarR family transcriptional regulator